MRREFALISVAMILGLVVMYLPTRLLPAQTFNLPPPSFTSEGQDMKDAPRNLGGGSGNSAPFLVDNLLGAGLVFSVGLVTAFGVTLFAKRKLR